MSPEALGVVTLPLVSVENGVATFIAMPAQLEDRNKRREGCVLRGLPLRPVLGQGLVGGKVEQGQTIIQAMVTEWDQETTDALGRPVRILDMDSRLKAMFEDIPIIQERPELTQFSVTLFLLQLAAEETRDMEQHGGHRVMLDMMTGATNSVQDGSIIEMRPAHADLLYLWASVAQSMKIQPAEVEINA